MESYATSMDIIPLAANRTVAKTFNKQVEQVHFFRKEWVKESAYSSTSRVTCYLIYTGSITASWYHFDKGVYHTHDSHRISSATSQVYQWRKRWGTAPHSWLTVCTVHIPFPFPLCMYTSSSKYMAKETYCNTKY